MHRKSKLSTQTILKLIEHFVAGTSARSAAVFCAVGRESATKWYHRFRIIIASHLEKDTVVFDGEVEVDESYFGGHRKGKRGRGAAGKTAVFGLYKRNGYVYTVSVDNTRSSTLISVINARVKPDSIVYTDQYKSYDTLDTSRFHHKRINHSKEFANDKNHINGIENFWRQAKRTLARYNGVPKHHFDLYLKECEWKFNYSPIDRLCDMLYNWIKEAGIALD